MDLLLWKITIPLQPVTKKNSQRILWNRRTGNRFVAPSDTFTRYQAACLAYIRPLEEPITEPVNIRCRFYRSTRHRVDLTNLLEAIDDVLVHYGVISDDRRDIVAGHDGSRVYYDRENPRTEIEIRPIGEDYEKWSKT